MGTAACDSSFPALRYAPYIGIAARDTRVRARSWGIEKLERLPQAVSFPAEQRPLSCARTAARRGLSPALRHFTFRAIHGAVWMKNGSWKKPN